MFIDTAKIRTKSGNCCARQFRAVIGMIQAILFSVGLLAGCGGIQLPSEHLLSLDSNEVGEVGRWFGCPFAVSVKGQPHIGEVVPLEIEVTNVTHHRVHCYFMLGDENVDYACELWLMHNGKQVPQTLIGRQTQPRTSDPFGVVMLLPKGMDLEASAKATATATLARYFAITEPGKYTLIAEPNWMLNNDKIEARSRAAAKTSFTILAQPTTDN